MLGVRPLNVLSFLGLFAAVLALLIWTGGSTPTQATTHTPTFSVAIPSPGPGLNSDIVVSFANPAPDAFPAGSAGSVTLTPGAFGVASDNVVPDGAIVGTFSTTVNLGFLNSPCAGPFPPGFTMMDANANHNDTTKVPGGPESPFWPGFYDGLANGGYEAAANGLPDAVDSWPNFQDGQLAALGGAAPIARYHGQTFVGALPVSLEILVFKPGDIPGIDASLGFGALTGLQNPFAATAPSAVTGDCTPLSVSSTTFGLSRDNGCTPFVSANCGFSPPDLGTSGGEGGAAVRTNPGTGSPTFSLRIVGQRDADGPCVDTTGASPSAVPPYSTGVTGDIGVDCAGDGIENDEDTCRTVPNITVPGTKGSVRGLRYGFLKANFVTPGVDANFFGNPASLREKFFPIGPLTAAVAAGLNSQLDAYDPDRSGSAVSHGDGIDGACDPNGEVSDLTTATCLVFALNPTGACLNENLGVPSVFGPLVPSCADGFDNDLDGLIDAADTGCLDTDGDAVSDKQDNCDFVANAAQTNTDNPGGALPPADQYGDACDPFPAFPQDLRDYDFDLFQNRGDNCSQVSNGGAAQTETAENTGVPLAPPASQTDDIGDACDPNPAVATGHFHVDLLTSPVSIGHDIELLKLSGAGFNPNGASLGSSTKEYTVKVRNNTTNANDNILVTLTVTPLGSCNAPTAVAAQSGAGIGTGSTDTGPVAPTGTVPVKFNVTFAGGCTSGTASDYAITADASHDDSDGFTDSYSNNDATITREANDNN